jgi:hypothetical protein
MHRLYVPTLGPTDWRRLLADPLTQWEPLKSALEMAVAWEGVRESQRGLPPEVAAALDSVPELAGASLLLGLPEHKVPFEGGGHPSQNDLWALLRLTDGLGSLAVEAKAGERLDELVKDWLPRDGNRSRKPERLAALQARLAIPQLDVSQVRYQLLHRTASALKEAERFGARLALLLIQSFARAADEQSWRDFCYFADLMGVDPQEGRFCHVTRPTAVPLYLGWVTSMPADLPRLRAAV